MTNWGDWSSAGSNSFRIGWDAAFSGGNQLNVWITIQNQYNVSGDAITLNWSGSWSGSQGATITASSGGQTGIYANVIGTQAYNSTSTTTFSVSGLYNGSTPSVTMVVNLPPIAPTAASTPSVTRVSDTQQNLTWTNNNTSSAPYDSEGVWRQDNVNTSLAMVAGVGSGVTSYSDTSTVADRQYQYLIAVQNSSGSANSSLSAVMSTTPAAPSSMNAVKDASGNIVLTWTNNSSYAANTTINIEESQNGGAYANLVTGLSGTTTTYTHTAPSTSVTHTYRVKAVSPNSLSSTYSTSPTITLLAAPNAPTPYTNPTGAHVGTTAFDATYTVTLSWVHNPTDGSPQSAYEVSHQYSTDGGTTWSTAVTTGKVLSTTQSATMAANTWVNGRKMRWQVRTWGAYTSAGAYSSLVTWDTSAIPTNTITTSATITAPTITGTGTYTDPEGTAQTGALWELRTTGGTSLERVILSSSFLSYTFTFKPVDGATYILANQVKDTTGLWSNEVTKTLTISLAVPPAPTLSGLTFNITTGKVTGTITNPGPGAGQVAAVSNRIYRDGVPIPELSAVGINSTFIDTPPLNSTVVYSVYATSSYPSYSTAATGTVTTLSAPLVQVVTPPSTPAGWYVDGIDLSTYAFNIENRSAGWSMPAPVGDNIKVPGRNGAFWVSDKPFDENELNLNMWAIGATTDGLVPQDISMQQQVMKNLDGLSTVFGRGRLLEIKRSSSAAEEGLVNRVINPTFRGNSVINDWTDLIPGWSANSTTGQIYNYFNNPNLSNLNVSNSRYTDAPRTSVTINGVTQYAAVKTATGTGALSITLTGGLSSNISDNWAIGATLYDLPTATVPLSGNITIQAQFRSSTTVVATFTSTVQYVRGKVFYVLAETPGLTFDNYIVTLTTASVVSGTTFGVIAPFFNSSRAWTQCIAGSMTSTDDKVYSWTSTVDDAVSRLDYTSKFSYSSKKSPRIVDGQDIGASLTSLSDYLASPYLALAGPNNQEIVLSVAASGVAGQWLYLDLDGTISLTPFTIRMELWNAGNLVSYQNFGTTPSGSVSFSTDGMMRAPSAFSSIVIRFSPAGAGAVAPQFYIGGQKLQINNFALMLESAAPILSTGYVPRYFPSEQLTNAAVSTITPVSYSGYMLVVPKTGPVSVSLTNGTTTQGPYTITAPALINPAWTSGWTYSVTTNGNYYHLSTGYRVSDSTTLNPPLWDGTRFIDSLAWNSNKQISNAAGWVNVLSNSTRSGSAYLPMGTLTYTYVSPLVALESGTTRLSGQLVVDPQIDPFSVISSAGIVTNTSYTLSVVLKSYADATRSTPTTLQTTSVTSTQKIQWIDVPISQGYAGVEITLTVTSPTAKPEGALFKMSDFMLVTTPTPRTSPVPYFDGDTSGCSWTGARYASPSIYGGSVRRCYAEVSDVIDFASMAGGSRASFNVSLRVPGVFWEDPKTVTMSSTVNLAANADYEIPLTQFTGSTAPIEDATIQIVLTSGSTSALSVSDKATGATLTVTKALTSGNTMMIVGGTADDNAYSVTDQDGNSVVPYLTRKNTSKFLPLTPMNPTQIDSLQAPVLVIRSTSAISLTVSVTGHRKFFLA